MKLLGVYEELVKLKQNKENKLSNSDIDTVWSNFLNTVPDESKRQARSFQKHLETYLRGYTDPEERLNKSIEVFWQVFHSFQLTLTNPNALVARTQDGSKAVIIPIDKRKAKDE